MYIYKAPNINGTVIAVTNTATPLYSLINTAASSSANNAGYPTEANGIDLCVEDGDIRFTLDGSTPTASKGVIVKQGSMLMLRGVPLKAMRLIRIGGSNVSCSVQVGRAELYESSAISRDAFSGSAAITMEARYNLTPITFNDGDKTELQSDANGYLKVVEQYAPVAEDNTRGVIATQNKPLAVSTYAWSVDKSDALEASSQSKAAAGIVRSVSGRIDSTAPNGNYYVQLIDAMGPPDGAVQFLCAPLKIQHTNGNDSNFSLDFTMNGIFASTAIFICLSSTEFTKTISGAFLSSTLLYK